MTIIAYKPQTNHYKGCPCVQMPFYQTTTHLEEARTPLINQYVLMRLVHLSKKGALKNSLNLTAIHERLFKHASLVQYTGASNVIISSLTFECHVTLTSRSFKTFVTFDLKIPGANTDENPTFTYESIEKKYKSKENLYQVLHHFYQKGRGIINPSDDQHGQVPDYDPKNSGQDQFIRHTEHYLVAYLASPAGSRMVLNRLIAEIRNLYFDVISVKLYNMSLHMHSTKTCCAPCEYVLIGLMNERTGFTLNQTKYGFLPNFQRLALRVNEKVNFTFPVKSKFGLLTTVSASEQGAHHTKTIARTPTSLKERDVFPYQEIPLKAIQSSRTIFTTVFTLRSDERRLPLIHSLTDFSVTISGSKATRGNSKTENRVRHRRSDDVDKLAGALRFLYQVS